MNFFKVCEFLVMFMLNELIVTCSDKVNNPHIKLKMLCYKIHFH